MEIDQEDVEGWGAIVLVWGGVFFVPLSAIWAAVEEGNSDRTETLMTKHHPLEQS